MRQFSSNKGFTLIEFIVASAIFLLLVSIASSIFIQALRTQRLISNFSTAINNASFSVETIAREIRTGSDFDGNGEIAVLSFTNAQGEKVFYKMVNGVVARCSTATPDGCTFDSDFKLITDPEIKINTLKFILTGTPQGDNLQSRVTILIGVQGEKELQVNLQTTISSRVPES